tara:strand:- start:106 stop:2043 length:1938 start_codon:yes stop_codon:yes gene_type:complete
MGLIRLEFNPGINKETTDYSNSKGWFDCDLVRFRFGYPEKIGGWNRFTSTTFLGTCRSLFPWFDLQTQRFMGVGTNLKFYVESGGSFNDITPLRSTTAAGDVTFGATSGSSIIVVTDSAHGAKENDFVTFSGVGASGLGGLITQDILNQEYRVETIVSINSYTIIAREVATLKEITLGGQYTPAPVAANGSDTGNGGTSIVGAYQINTGLDSQVVGTGWGVGTWSREGWGESTNISLVTDRMRLWSQDNFGQHLIFNARDGGIFYWQNGVVGPPASLDTRAVNITSLSGATSAPQVAKQVIVSDRDRHIIVFGCDPELDPGNQDPLTIRFSSSGSLVKWNTADDTTAGELRIGSGSAIITAIETRQQVLVFTDTSLHSLQYVGAPFYFGINSISESLTIASPNAAIAVEDVVFWMGTNEFFAFSGTVSRLPCSVRDHVFSNINTSQLEKVVAGSNNSFAEVWWFYPSADSEINNRYVVYNYQQQIWYYGSLSRSFWIDKGALPFPVAATSNGQLLNHENGFDNQESATPQPITSYIESSPIDLGQGDNFAFISRLIPDVTFRNSTQTTPSLTMDIQMKDYPGADYSSTGSASIVKSTSLPVEQFTNYINTRLRGRSFSMKVVSNQSGTTWRLGTPRLELRPDGKR